MYKMLIIQVVVYCIFGKLTKVKFLICCLHQIVLTSWNFVFCVELDSTFPALGK